MTTCLNQLSIGQRGKIIGYRRTNPALLQRLLEMGLTRGVEVQVQRFAPLGDPMEISLRGYQLSVRLEEAALVEIEHIQ